MPGQSPDKCGGLAAGRSKKGQTACAKICAVVQLPGNAALIENDGACVFLNHRAFFHLQAEPFRLQLGVANSQAAGGVDVDVAKVEPAERRFRGADNIGRRFAIAGGG